MNKINLWKVFALSAIFSLGFTSCDEDNEVTIDEKFKEVYNTPKYVFYFIGDGMSNSQINVTEAALSDPNFRLKTTKNTKAVTLEHLNIRDFPVTGMQTTHAEDRYITGSAAAATALATGYKTTIGTISKDGNHSRNLKTMAEMAKEKGMKVGIITSVSIDHATPACFYAHTDSRNNYQVIGQDLINSDFDYFAGGNVRFNKYKNYSLENFITDAKQKAYSYVNSKADFDALNNNSGKTIATLKKLETYTNDGSALPYAIDVNAQESADDQITLADFTKKGIEVLDNDKGFFMMVEGGKIDWACHANDVVSSTMDVIAFDQAIGEALAFYKEHPEETLIIITGDHETGGLTLGYAGTGYDTAFERLQYQSESYAIFQNKVKAWKSAGNATITEALAEVEKSFGLGDGDKGLALSDYEKDLLEDAFNRSMSGESDHQPEEISVIYGSYDPFTVTVTHILNNKVGIDWGTYSHTGVPVPVFALGQGDIEFNGYYDNTDVAKKIIDIAKYDKN